MAYRYRDVELDLGDGVILRAKPVHEYVRRWARLSRGDLVATRASFTFDLGPVEAERLLRALGQWEPGT